MNSQASQTAPLVDVLGALRRRHRVVSMVRWAAWGVLAGGVLACIAALALWATLHLPGARLALVGVACLSLVSLVAALVGFLLPIDDLRLARAMDRAAASEDRLASALQIAASAPAQRRSRAAMIVQDALASIQGTAPAAALPVRLPHASRWIPLPVLVLLMLVVALPPAGTRAIAAQPPEIAPEEWAALHDEFKKELQQIPKAQSPEEQELQRQLEQLAEMLRQNPDKRDVLREIAKLSDRIDQQRKATGSARAQSMRAAAKALAASQALKPFAQQLQEGSYEQAASELSKLSDQLKSGENSPDAKEFEAMAADLQRLSEQLETEKDLQNECQKCSSCAGSMNKQALAEAMKKFAEEMKKNADKLRKCDSMCKRSSALDALKRKMSQCKSCKSGNCTGDGFCQNPGKGGKKAGWGSAANWEGGSIAKNAEQRDPDMVNPLERQGVNTTFQVVSPDEKAASAKKYEELYAEFVAKNEADLDLESVPVAYREYLRKYFNAIRPKEAAPSGPTPEPSPE